MRVGQGIPPCCPFYSAGLTYPRRYLGFFHQHGWGLTPWYTDNQVYLRQVTAKALPVSIPMRLDVC